MKIKYLAHSAFLLSSAKGIRILTDPYESGSYGGALGYKKIDEETDIISISHNHADHNYISREHDKAKVIREPGTFTIKGITLRGISLYHDSNQGSERGSNIAYILTIDGINYCHLGDLGHTLNREELSEIGSVDVLMIPVGGTFTINSKEAWQVVESISPRVCMPMHYKTKSVGFNLELLNNFISDRNNVRVLAGSEIELSKTSIPEKTEIWVLKPSKI